MEILVIPSYFAFTGQCISEVVHEFRQKFHFAAVSLSNIGRRIATVSPLVAMITALEVLVVLGVVVDSATAIECVC